MNTAKVPLVRCRNRGFENQNTALGCFLCGMSLAGAEPVVARARPGVIHSHATAYHTRIKPPLGLTSVLLLIAVSAVFYGVMRLAPGLAVILAIPAGIAMICTMGPFTYCGSSLFDDLPVVV